MALFHAKFSCNLAISNLVFRWKSCKGSVWKSVKKCSSLSRVAGTCDWILRVPRYLQAARSCTCAKHVQKLKRQASWSTTGQKVQTCRLVTSWLELMTQSSLESKPPASPVLKNLTLRIPFSFQYKYPLYPRNVESFQREYWERNPREKQDWLIHNLHIETLQIPLLSSFTLILSIVTSLGALLPKPFLTIPTYVRRPFGAWEAVRKGPISYWLMLWFIAESGKLKKK